nr:iron dicitrate transport regulator FecR [Bacteroidales bacterium]
MHKSISEIFLAESEAIKSIPADQDFEGVAQLIHEKVHVLGGKVIVSGMGKAGQVANNIATTFSSTGTPSIFLHPSEAQHGD